MPKKEPMKIKDGPFKITGYSLYDYELLYGFAFDMYQHEATAAIKVKLYLKSKNAQNVRRTNGKK